MVRRGLVAREIAAGKGLVLQAFAEMLEKAREGEPMSLEGILRAKLEDLKEEVLTDSLSIVIHQLLEGHFSDVLEHVGGLDVKPDDKEEFEKAVQRVVKQLKK